MAYNWKEGIDHVTQQPLPNHVFVLGECGMPEIGDDTGAGTPSDPYFSLTTAYANTSNGDTIIFLGNFINQVGSSGGGWSNRIFIGDSATGNSLIEDTSGTRTAFVGVTVKNCLVKGYNKAIDGSGSTFENVELQDNNTTDMNGGTVLDRCVITNSNLTVINNCTVLNSKFFASNIINNASTNTGLLCDRSTFDLNSGYVASTGTGNVVLRKESHVHDLSTFDNGNSTGLTILTGITEEVTTPSLVNEPNYLGRSTMPNSTFIKNDADGNVGNYYAGISFGPSSTEFLNIIANSADIEFVGGEILPLASVPVGTTVYSDPYLFVASQRTQLGRVDQIGSGLLCNYFLEIKVADDGEILANQPFRKFRLGEEMTQDSSGLATGDDNYNWNERLPVIYRMAEFRLGITKL